MFPINPIATAPIISKRYFLSSFLNFFLAVRINNNRQAINKLSSSQYDKNSAVGNNLIMPLFKNKNNKIKTSIVGHSLISLLSL